ncbi:MAG: PP2C family protein-serine/threonine phosphatase [Selenomonadaceae bacterium]|nr:PP2C family protein-serine/threonine phosphatase [Selenomonadaceae bacterium]
MKLQNNSSLLSRTGLQQMILTAVCYLFFLSLTNYTVMKLPWLQFRFAAFVPVVSGIMFGLPGAAGALIGNLMGDIGSSTPLPVCLLAGLLNFFLAYLPYRLWFGWHGKKALSFISDSASFARFTAIAIVNGFIFAVSLTALIDSFFPVHSGLGFSFFILFSNNYDFPVLLGLPLLLFLRRRAAVIYRPDPRPGRYLGGLQKQALYLLVLLDILYLILCHCRITDAALSQTFFVFSLLMLGYICTMPSECDDSCEANSTFSLAGSTTELLLLFATGFIVLALTGILLMQNDAGQLFEDIQHWQLFYIILSIPLNGAFIVFYFLLRWLEKTISNPLAALSLRAHHYMETGRDEESAVIAEAAAKNEIEVLNQSFTQMTQDIKHYLADLTAAAEAKHSLQSQLDVAALIQQGTLPNLDSINSLLQTRNQPYIIKGSMQAARQVGGDMLDCGCIDDDHILLTVGDVAGKGVPAALFAMVTQALIDNSTCNKPSCISALADIAGRVNNALEANNRETLFVTLWTGILELSSGRITYVNAGHNPPMLAKLDGSGELHLLEELSGPVLGLMPDIPYTSHTALLPPDHKLLIFTDGLNEAENRQHEFYGDERLREMFLRAKAPEEIMEDINHFVGDAPPSDDKTYLWVERN